LELLDSYATTPGSIALEASATGELPNNRTIGSVKSDNVTTNYGRVAIVEDAVVRASTEGTSTVRYRAETGRSESTRPVRSAVAA
jgi:hypothetical protein